MEFLVCYVTLVNRRGGGQKMCYRALLRGEGSVHIVLDNTGKGCVPAVAVCWRGWPPTEE